MEVPRRLCHTNVNYLQEPHIGHVVEADDINASIVIAPAGYVMSDEEAQRLGIADYLKAHPKAPEAEASVEAKAVEQSEVEDKAVAGPEQSKAAEPTPEEPKAEEPAEVRRPPGRRG